MRYVDRGPAFLSIGRGRDGPCPLDWGVPNALGAPTDWRFGRLWAGTLDSSATLGMGGKGCSGWGRGARNGGREARNGGGERGKGLVVDTVDGPLTLALSRAGERGLWHPHPSLPPARGKGLAGGAWGEGPLTLTLSHAGERGLEVGGVDPLGGVGGLVDGDDGAEGRDSEKWMSIMGWRFWRMPSMKSVAAPLKLSSQSMGSW